MVPWAFGHFKKFDLVCSGIREVIVCCVCCSEYVYSMKYIREDQRMYTSFFIPTNLTQTCKSRLHLCCNYGTSLHAQCGIYSFPGFDFANRCRLQLHHVWNLLFSRLRFYEPLLHRFRIHVALVKGLDLRHHVCHRHCNEIAATA